MISWKKNYSEGYKEDKAAFDPHVVELINAKEEIILSSPTTYPFLKHKFKKTRYFKAGKLRIFYILSTERADKWEKEPPEPEVMFVYGSIKKQQYL